VAGPATDVYGVGALLAFMLTGQAPDAFRAGGDDRAPARAERVDGLLALARQCLEADPARRPSSAAELAAYLRGWIGGPLGATGPRGAPVPAQATRPSRPVSPDARTLPAASVPAAASRRERPPRAGTSRRSLRSVAPAAALVAVLVGAALVAAPLLSGRGPEPTGPASTPLAGAPTGDPEPTPTPAPTPPPPGGRIVVLEPADGSEVDADEIVVSGLAPPGSTVVRDFGFFETQSAEAGPDGAWLMRIRLDPGDNSLTFRVGDDALTSRTIHVSRP
jgi:hypothetical protein